MMLKLALLLSIFFTSTFCSGAEENFVKVVAKVKAATVGVGVYDALGTVRTKLLGTGFAVGNGQFIATNYHVVAELPESRSVVRWVVFSGTGNTPETHFVDIVATDKKHDIAILKLPTGVVIEPLDHADNEWLADGHRIAFTGFPIGEVLGLYPVTHQGIISAKTPTIIPVANSSSLDPATIKLLQQPYFTYQLDATAYPGNSGSPVYLQSTGQVIAVINKVFVKSTKESVLSDPSNITYAIPIKYVNMLLDKVI